CRGTQLRPRRRHGDLRARPHHPDQLVLHPEPPRGRPGLMSTTTVTAPRAQPQTDAAKPVPARRHRLGRPATWGWSILAIVVAIAWAFPVYWMVNSALLPTSALESFTPTFVPFGGSFANFRAVIDESFFSALGISLSVTLIAVFFCLLFPFLAAIAISRFKFRGRTSFIIAILLI